MPSAQAKAYMIQEVQLALSRNKDLLILFGDYKTFGKEDLFMALARLLDCLVRRPRCPRPSRRGFVVKLLTAPPRHRCGCVPERCHAPLVPHLRGLPCCDALARAPSVLALLQGHQARQAPVTRC